MRRTDPATLGSALAAECAEALAHPGSVAVIAADDAVPATLAMLASSRTSHELLAGPATSGTVTVVPVTLAKGLEFDHVIVLEPARIAAAEDRGLHRLYVALTRAVSRLTVLHTADLPELLVTAP
jgi:DNA helicase IV